MSSLCFEGGKRICLFEIKRKSIESRLKGFETISDNEKYHGRNRHGNDKFSHFSHNPNRSPNQTESEEIIKNPRKILKKNPKNFILYKFAYFMHKFRLNFQWILKIHPICIKIKYLAFS